MKEYNGYANYFTWAVALWLDNDQGSTEYWIERAAEVLEDNQTMPESLSDIISPEEWTEGRIRNASVHGLAEEMAEEISDVGPGSGSGICEDMPGMYADLFTAVFDFIDWREIAGHYIDAAEERRQEESEN